MHSDPSRAPVPGVRWVLLVAIGLAVVLRLQALSGEFHHDDLRILYYLQGMPSTLACDNQLDLYHWFDGDADSAKERMATGAIPWYFDDKQKLAHFRPAASALMCLDFALFGMEPFWPHVHSMLWMVLVVCAAAVVYRVALSPPQATLALLLFAISPFLAGGVEWWCARCSLIAAAFGFLGLAAHVKWRQSGWRPGAVLSLCAFGVALLAAEAAVQCLAFVVAYALLGDRGSLRSRLTSLLGPTALFVVYLAVRSGLGYGVARTPIYVDPFGAPLAFLQNTIQVLPRLGSELLLPWAPFTAGSRWLYRTAAVLSVIVFLWLLRSTLSASRSRTTGIRWLLVGTLLSLLPAFAATQVRWQTLFMPILGLAAASAAVLHHGWAVVRGHVESTPRRRVTTAVLCTAFLGANIIAPALYGPVVLAQAAENMPEEKPITSVIPLDPRVTTLVILRASDFQRVGAYVRGSETARLGAALTLSLTQCSDSCTVTRSGPARLILDVEQGSLVPPHDDWRSSEYPLEDREIAFGTVRIRILEMNGDAVTKAEFEFDRSLDDPTLAFGTQSGSLLTPVALPPVGGHVRLR